MSTSAPRTGENVPTEEQFDKEKAKAEIQSLDTTLANDKPAPNQALGSLPGVQLNGAEKEKYESEMAKLYKELDDKVSDAVSQPREKTYRTPVFSPLEVQ